MKALLALAWLLSCCVLSQAIEAGARRIVTTPLEFTEALADATVETIVVSVTSLIIDDTAFTRGVVLISRNVTIHGDPALPDAPLLRLIATKKIKLGQSASLTFGHVTLYSPHKDNLTRAPSLRILERSDAGSRALLVTSNVFLFSESCNPLAARLANLVQLTRVMAAAQAAGLVPAGIPLNVTASVNQTGCISVNMLHPGSVPMAQRCWPDALFYASMIGPGQELNTAGAPEPTNYIWLVQNLTAPCLRMADQACIDTYGPIGCNAWAISNLTPMPVVAVGEDGGDGGSGVPAGDASGGSSEAVIGIAVGCALGGAALLALSLGFIWWRRRSSRERGAGEGAVLAGKERQGAAQQGGGLLPDATAEGDGDGAAGKGLEAAAPGEADLESSGGGCSSSTCGGGVRTDGEGESTREATGTADGTAEAPHCVVVKMAGDSSPVINGAVLGGGIDTAQLQQRPLPRPAAPAVGTLQSRHQQQQQPPAGSFIKRMLTAGGSGAGRLQPLSTAAMLCDDDLCGSQALGLSNGSAAQMMGHVAGASASASATTAITADTSAAAHQQLAFLASPVMPTTPYRPDLDLNLSLNTSVALSGELYKAAVISAAAAAAAGGASPDFGGAGPCRLACSPSPAAAEDGGLQLLQQQQQQQQQQRRWAPPNAKPPTLVNLLLGTQGSGSEAVEVRSRTQTQQLHDGIVLLPDASGRLVAVDSARLALGCYSCGGGGGGEEPAALGSAGTANDSAAVPSGVYIDVGMAQVETAWMVTTNLDADDRGGGEQQQLLLQQAPSQPASATPVQQDLQPQPQQQDEEQPPQGPLTFISNIMQMDARGRERPMTGRGGGGGGGGGTYVVHNAMQLADAALLDADGSCRGGSSGGGFSAVAERAKVKTAPAAAAAAGDSEEDYSAVAAAAAAAAPHRFAQAAAEHGCTGGGGSGAAWEHSAPLWGAGGGGSLHRDIDLALLTAAYVSSNANGASDNTLHLLPVVLGRGGCGRVYEGVYRGQKVAVKMLLKGAGDGAAGDTAVLVEALQQEVEVLGRCSHPNVVRLIAACLDRHQPCLVMELCETSLEALIFRGRGGGGSAAAPPPLMPLEQVLNVALGICSALSYMHPTITHRDLKPANVLLNNAASRVPEVKLTDFGLARLRATTMPTLEPEAGTAAYLAPECFDVQNTYVTPHADLYSLGVCIWAMLTGEQPWRDYSVVAVAYKVCSKGERLPMSQLPDARCPPKLRRLVTALFSAHPRRRPAAEEVAKELMLLQQQLYMEQNPRNNGP